MFRSGPSDGYSSDKLIHAAELFHRHPDINPLTGRAILMGGPAYKKLVLQHGLPGNHENLEMFDRYKYLRECALKVEHPPNGYLSWLITKLKNLNRNLSLRELLGEYAIAYYTLDQLITIPSYGVVNAYTVNNEVIYNANIYWITAVKDMQHYISGINQLTTLVKAQIVLVEKSIQCYDI